MEGHSYDNCRDLPFRNSGSVGCSRNVPACNDHVFYTTLARQQYPIKFYLTLQLIFSFSALVMIKFGELIVPEEKALKIIKKSVLLILCSTLFIGSLFGEPKEKAKNANLVFSNLDDEYKLASYFLSYQQKKYYKKLNESDQWHYLEAFWQANDLDPTTEENEFLVEIRSRISYADEHFTHFFPGWKSDRGRILIRFGEPYEILKQTTSGTVKYPEREYEIWKYRISEYLTYIFIDLQVYGDYRLIYSENDPLEGSWPDWDSYLGSDFDYNILY